MDYDDEVAREARRFIFNHEDAFKEIIEKNKDPLFYKHFNLNDEVELDSAFREITIFCTPKDAIYILENCHNEETDRCLWEHIHDWNEELNVRAAYSFFNDVRVKIEEYISDLIIIRFETDLSYTVMQIFNDFKDLYTVKPVTDRKEQISLIEEWIELGRKVILMSGYPVGNSYIDSRCECGYGTPDNIDYINLDRDLAKKIPKIAGKYKMEVMVYLSKIKKIRRNNIPIEMVFHF